MMYQHAIKEALYFSVAWLLHVVVVDVVIVILAAVDPTNWTPVVGSIALYVTYLSWVTGAMLVVLMELMRMMISRKQTTYLVPSISRLARWMSSGIIRCGIVPLWYCGLVKEVAFDKIGPLPRVPYTPFVAAIDSPWTSEQTLGHHRTDRRCWDGPASSSLLTLSQLHSYSCIVVYPTWGVEASSLWNGYVVLANGLSVLIEIGSDVPGMNDAGCSLREEKQHKAWVASSLVWLIG